MLLAMKGLSPNHWTTGEFPGGFWGYFSANKRSVFICLLSARQRRDTQLCIRQAQSWPVLRS